MSDLFSLQGRNATMTAEFKSKMEAKIPIGRIGTPEDCVGQVILFASDAGAYLTGHVDGIDGGLKKLNC